MSVVDTDVKLNITQIMQIYIFLENTAEENISIQEIAKCRITKKCARFHMYRTKVDMGKEHTVSIGEMKNVYDISVGTT